MRRWLIVLATLLVAAAGVAALRANRHNGS